MAKVKFLRNTVANRKVYEENQTADLPDAEARFLVGIRKAVFVNDEPKPEAEIPAVNVEVERTDAAVEEKNEKKRSKRKE